MKHLYPTLIIAVLIPALLLSACGKSSENTVSEPKEAEEQFVYASKTLMTRESTKEDAAALQPAAFTDDGYYAIGGVLAEEKIPQGAVAEYENQFVIMDPCISFVGFDGNAAILEKYSPVRVETGNEDRRDYIPNNTIEGFFLNSEGNIELLESVFISYSEAEDEIKYGTEEYSAALRSETHYFLRVLNNDGSELSCAEVDLPEAEEASFYIIFGDSADNLVIPCSNGLIAVSKSGERAYEIPVNGYIYSAARLKDGRTALMLYDFSENGLSVKPLDPTAGNFTGESYSVGIDANAMIDGCGDYDFFFYTGSSMFGYVIAENRSDKLFSWADCDLSSGKLYKTVSAPDGTFMTFSMDYDEESETVSSELIKIEKVPYDKTSEKAILTLGSLNADEPLRDAVIKFNRHHDNVRINIIDYSERLGDDYRAGYTKLMTEIASGSMPDILDIGIEMPYRRFAAKGLFEDLYPFIDADSELSRDDFFENVMKALEVDEKLYSACAGFGVYTAVGAASVVGDTPGWDYDDYYAALASMPDDCEGFGIGMTKDAILSYCMALEVSRFVDWNTGKCSFDSPDFVKLLEFANSFPDDFDYDNYEYSASDSDNARIAEGRQMLAISVFSSTKYIMTDYDELFGGKATIIGFPTTDGVGNMLAITSQLAISSKCADKQAAWEFVRTYLTEAFQKTIYYIPTNINVFERQVSNAMKQRFETDANGNFKLDENGERIPRVLGSYYDGVSTVDVYALSEHQADILREAIAGSEKLLNFDQSIEEIVQEGAKPYFSGDKTAAECAKLIQSKANIYVNEQG